jgi:hypothetical protein
MACSSCGIMGGFEHYTNGAGDKAKTQDQSCPAKELMGECMYTAQGLLICNTPEGAAKSPVGHGQIASENVLQQFVQKRPLRGGQ